MYYISHMTSGRRSVILFGSNRATSFMSRRYQRHDETSMKQAVTALNTGVHNDSGGGLSTGGWRRRSLFSTERLDLILSNLRRNLGRSVDGEQCKQISHDVSYSRDAGQCQRQQQQQLPHGAGKHIPRQCFAVE